MKYLFIFMTLLSLMLSATSCNDDEGLSMEEICDDALTDLGSSAANWATSSVNHTQINCNTFKASLLTVLNNCETQEYWELYGGQQGWEDFVDEIEMLDCSLFP